MRHRSRHPLERFGTPMQGAYDMVGNVFEWTSSKWSKGGGTYVWRGGSFNNNRRNARSSFRNYLQPLDQLQNLGFRLAGGCGTDVTVCRQNPAERWAGACYSTAGGGNGVEFSLGFVFSIQLYRSSSLLKTRRQKSEARSQNEPPAKWLVERKEFWRCV